MKEDYNLLEDDDECLEGVVINLFDFEVERNANRRKTRYVGVTRNKTGKYCTQIQFHGSKYVKYASLFSILDHMREKKMLQLYIIA